MYTLDVYYTHTHTLAHIYKVYECMYVCLYVYKYIMLVYVSCCWFEVVQLYYKIHLSVPFTTGNHIINN